MNYIIYVESKEFDVFAESDKCPQVIIHNKKPIYGVLFHSEVRNKTLLINFTKL